MLNIFIDFQPEDHGRPTTGTTGNGYTRGSCRVVKTVYPQTHRHDLVIPKEDQLLSHNAASKHDLAEYLSNCTNTEFLSKHLMSGKLNRSLQLRTAFLESERDDWIHWMFLILMVYV